MIIKSVEDLAVMIQEAVEKEESCCNDTYTLNVVSKTYSERSIYFELFRNDELVTQFTVWYFEAIFQILHYAYLESEVVKAALEDYGFDEIIFE